MKRNVIETIMGGVVLILAGVFLVFAYSSRGLTRVAGYEVSAKFNRVDGLSTGGEVRMSGIKIGSVTNLRLDPETYLAVVRMSVQDSVKLPTDSTARIQADGLLGNYYVLLEPGGEDAIIEPGGEIQFTQDPINLGDLISRYIFSSGDKKDAGAADGAEPPAP